MSTQCPKAGCKPEGQAQARDETGGCGRLMRYDAELIRLKDKTYGVLRNAEPCEGGKMLELMRACAGETEYLIHYPDEIIRSDESEAAFIQMTNESDGTLMLVCDIDGELVGFSEKVDRRVR